MSDKKTKLRRKGYILFKTTFPFDRKQFALSNGEAPKLFSNLKKVWQYIGDVKTATGRKVTSYEMFIREGKKGFPIQVIGDNINNCIYIAYKAEIQ